MITITEDQRDVHKLFRLDRETGRLYWLSPTKYHPKLAGKEAGAAQRNRGKVYWAVQIDGKKIKRGRIVFYMTRGFWPSPCVDHINGDSTDDRPENLRQATIEQNAWNHKSRKKQSACPMGVRKTEHGNYQARITHNKQVHHLGVFETQEQASKAYLLKRKELFCEFA